MLVKSLYEKEERTAWSSREMCVNWNEPHVIHLQLYEQPSALNDA